ncbi:MAG: RES family NAD+ phosphorylase [Pseudonocardiaceae bacterium]
MPGQPLAPEPPATLHDSATQTIWPAGAPLYRCHSKDLDANTFNPKYGSGGRFHWFDDLSGVRIPVLYAAESRRCAIYETIFHDIPIRGTRKFLRGSRLIGQQLSELVLAQNTIVNLVELHDPGLLRLGLRPSQLTATNANHYGRTVAWAQALHQQLPWAQGLLWMSARLNTVKCLMLYGDRIESTGLRVVGTSMPLDGATGSRYVQDLGRQAGIDVSRSWTAAP